MSSFCPLRAILVSPDANMQAVGVVHQLPEVCQLLSLSSPYAIWQYEFSSGGLTFPDRVQSYQTSPPIQAVPPCIMLATLHPHWKCCSHYCGLLRNLQPKSSAINCSESESMVIGVCTRPCCCWIKVLNKDVAKYAMQMRSLCLRCPHSCML